jgi:hypothetical protein
MSTAPRICVTLDLDVHVVASSAELSALAVGSMITSRSWVVRAGSRIVITGFDVATPDGRTIAVGNAGFMASPNPAHVVDGGFPLDSPDRRRGRLGVPFADRAGVIRSGGRSGDGSVDGSAMAPYLLDNINATGAIQGGIVALVAEEAVADAAGGRIAESMSIRYLRGFRGTPATAHATITGSLGRVEVLGDDGRPGALVTVRLAPDTHD